MLTQRESGILALLGRHWSDIVARDLPLKNV